MPVYTYKCNECSEVYEKFHSIKIRLMDCILCSAESSLERIPSNIASVIYKNSDGKIVREYIEDTKSEVRKYKRDLQKVDKIDD